MSQHLHTTILEHREVAARYYRLKLEAPSIAATARAGQYVHILPRPKFSFDPLLRRAFSILNTEGDTIEVLYRVEGRGTALLSKLQPGDVLDIIGPLGVAFAFPSANSVLVGGGVGVPPLAMLATQTARAHQSGKMPPITALIGARSKSEIICRENFHGYGIPLAIATDDGSAGHHGRVTELLEKHLQKNWHEDNSCIVFACGPLAMLQAVATISASHGVRCQVSLEENMPCGVGVCNGCVVPVVGAGDDYGSYRRICVEGPVLWADQVDWSHYQNSSC